MTETAQATEPSRADVDTLEGPAVLEFGAQWCGYCLSIQPLLRASFERHSRVRHFKIEDGPGRPLGRSFGVRLWPTLVFLRDGKEVMRLTRPRDPSAIHQALQRIDQGA